MEYVRRLLASSVAMEYKILTYGKLASDFSELVKKQYPDLSVLLANSQSEVKSLLPQVNAIAGFNFLSGEDTSTIKWIHSFGAGVDAFLSLDALVPETILTRTKGKLGVKMGEFCLAYILADLRAMFPIHDNQKKKHWEQLSTENLYDKTVLVLGTGSIGSGIAQKLKGLCKRLIGLNSSRSDNDLFDEICNWETYPALAKQVDVVISALPSTATTNSVLNPEFFARFEKVLFINVGRGNVVTEEGLLLSIGEGSIRKAVLDVFSIEPLPESSPLWSHEQIVISPHQSGITSAEEVLESFSQAYEAIKQGKKNELFVDIERGY